ncbi:MAG: hypothetical protein ACSHWN_11585 [Methylophilaceae bacterium]
MKNRFILLITTGLLLLSQVANADFRRALDAYIARDGDTMLKEVKDAVDKKNNDGLMLFLMATNLDVATSDYDETAKQSKSTLRTILSDSKWDGMYNLLVQATNYSSVDAQYYLFSKTPFSKTYIQKRIVNEKQLTDANQINTDDVNEIYVKLDEKFSEKGAVSAIIKSYSNTRILGGVQLAEAGDPFVQMQLGLQYLNDHTVSYGYGCPKSSTHPICKSKNSDKGISWLKRATYTYDTSGVDDYDIFASAMCEYEYNHANGAKAKLVQSYLWCLSGIQERGEYSQSMQVLRAIRQSRGLSKGELKLFGNWEADFVPIHSQLPAWLKEARIKAANSDMPVFTYYFVYGAPYLIELYEDGRVYVSFFDLHNTHKDLLLKTTPEKIKKFLSELNEIGVNDWKPKENLDYCFGSTPHSSIHLNMQLNIRVADKRNRKYLFSCNKGIRVDTEKVANIRMGKIYTLVEQYFPTSFLRCEMGSSMLKKQACLSRNNIWKNIK